MTKQKYDLVKYAVLVTLEEKEFGNLFNHVIHFSTFTNNLYCLYFEDDYIFNKPQLIVPTLLQDQEINKFESMMLQKNIRRVAIECLDIIQFDYEYLEINEK